MPLKKVSSESGAVQVEVVFARYDRSINWRWRRAARAMVERDSVLSPDRVQTLFNPFFRDNAKFYDGVIDSWISAHPSPSRIFLTTPARYMALSGQAKQDVRKAAKKAFTDRFECIIQRRHDCIHNCDRPKYALQPISPGPVKKALIDVSFFVSQCNSHIDQELHAFLVRIGCSPTTLNRLQYS